jgi:predicted DNA-binding antitoxin AbrB/MazE fold protein
MRPIDASYENGILKLDEPLPFRSGERVAVVVIRKPDPSRWDLARLAATGRDDLALADAGLADWVSALDREDRY